MEILSPAGSFDAAVAAVLNGTDAIYLGQQQFNARQNAENFDKDALNRAISFCHLHNVKVYQTLNTVVFDDELEALQETIQTACEAGVDAFIVQDFGVLNLLRKTCPQMRVHGSTQMSVHTVKGAELMKNLGLSRVVLAREMSLPEIEAVIQNVDIEVEVFVHGALCMSVSGQCYMSAMIGGRSGNKGSCAGTCRLPFSAVEGEGYDLSLKDLCGAEQYRKLEAIGVTSLKIEGRMKRPEYVAAAAKAYSDLKNGGSPDLEELKAVFSRSGFTDGYLTGKVDGEMFGIRSKEDVLSASGEVLSNLQKTYSKEKPLYPVKMEFSLKAAQPARITLNDNEGNLIKAEGDIPEMAVKCPTTPELAKESLEKLGGTPFFMAKFTADIDDGLMLPKSKLNELRREAIDRLTGLRSEAVPVPFTPAVLAKREKRKEHTLKLRARFRDCGQIPFDQLEHLEAIYVPVDQALRYTNVLLPVKDKIILEPDRIMFGTEAVIIEKLKNLAAKGFTRMAASNPAHLRIGTELGYQVCGTHFLNITNSLSAELYHLVGLSDTVLSAEGTVGQLSRVNPVTPLGDMALGAVIYGYLPLMVVKNCPVKRHIGCSECKGTHALTDRLGNQFRVTCNMKKYSEVLNCNVLELADKLEDFNRFDFGLLYFTVESKADCKEVIQGYLAGQEAAGNFTRGLYYRGIH